VQHCAQRFGSLLERPRRRCADDNVRAHRRRRYAGVRAAAPRKPERIGNQRHMAKAQRARGGAEPVGGVARLQRFARIGFLGLIGRAGMLGQRRNRGIRSLEEIFISVRVDGQHTQLTRQRAAVRADRLCLHSARFPKHFRCLGARDVPINRQAIVVQHFDLIGVFRRSAEQRVIAPQQRQRGTHQRTAARARSRARDLPV